MRRFDTRYSRLDLCQRANVGFILLVGVLGASACFGDNKSGYSTRPHVQDFFPLGGSFLLLLSFHTALQSQHTRWPPSMSRAASSSSSESLTSTTSLAQLVSRQVVRPAATSSSTSSSPLAMAIPRGRPLLEGPPAPSILEALSAKAGALIRTLDNIKKRSCLSTLKLVFPQIIVLGEESSGKSSVLERLSMCEFFPRSEGICTRMPIEFEMIHKSEQEMRDFCTAKKVPFVSNDCYCLVSSKRSTGEVREYGFFGAAEVRDKVKPTMDREVKRHNGGSSCWCCSFVTRVSHPRRGHDVINRCSRSDQRCSQHCHHRPAGS